MYYNEAQWDLQASFVVTNFEDEFSHKKKLICNQEAIKQQFIIKETATSAIVVQLEETPLAVTKPKVVNYDEDQIIDFEVNLNYMSKSKLGEPKNNMQSCPKTIQGHIPLIGEMEQESKIERQTSPWKIGVHRTLDVVLYSIEE